MDWYLLLGEGVQTVENGVDVPDGCSQVEDGVEINAAGDLWIAADELGEVRLLSPGARGVPGGGGVGGVAGGPRLYERQQQPMAEDEPVTRLEVPPHPLGIDDEAFDDPGEAVEHV